MNLTVAINCVLICLMAVFVSLGLWEYKNSKADKLELTRSEWRCTEISRVQCVEFRKKGY